ncbi:hypothetical protein BDZ45DRAFT_751763 [Acephala macrosclerotiorum]|nr:hypothetical protein BDZ45DRAFT_751763 [Acephala macrosclerotiorum]
MLERNDRAARLHATTSRSGKEDNACTCQSITPLFNVRDHGLGNPFIRDGLVNLTETVPGGAIGRAQPLLRMRKTEYLPRVLLLELGNNANNALNGRVCRAMLGAMWLWNDCMSQVSTALADAVVIVSSYNHEPLIGIRLVIIPFGSVGNSSFVVTNSRLYALICHGVDDHKIPTSDWAMLGCQE